tara:strand:+ start:40 stop:288 length:249 start_codon:yes stop_codon:yes gene_type:complete
MMNQNFKYHYKKYWAEIRVEGCESFYFVNAFGDNEKQFITAIQSRLKEYKDHDPVLVFAIKEPNKRKIDITFKIKSQITGEK